jgi:hypothetical protein
MKHRTAFAPTSIDPLAPASVLPARIHANLQRLLAGDADLLERALPLTEKELSQAEEELSCQRCHLGVPGLKMREPSLWETVVNPELLGEYQRVGEQRARALQVPGTTLERALLEGLTDLLGSVRALALPHVQCPWYGVRAYDKGGPGAAPHWDDIADLSNVVQAEAQLAFNVTVSEAAAPLSLWSRKPTAAERARAQHGWAFQPSDGPSVRWQAPRGTLYLFDSTRIHAVAGSSAGRRVTVSGFAILIAGVWQVFF